jgi:VWFA-related protein
MRPALLSLTLLAAASLAAQQPPPFTAKTNLVVVPAVVVDKKGATVESLTQADFQVFEDGKAVAIETFLAPSVTGVTGEQGRFIVVALDNLTTPADIAFRVRNIAKMFVDKMGPNDVMSVITISGGNAVTTSMKTELNAAIARFAPSAGGDLITGVEKKRHGLRMLTSLSQQVDKVNHRRKVMVFIGDNAMLNPNDPTADQTGDLSLVPEWQDAIKATTRNNVSVYLIDPKGLPGATAADQFGANGASGLRGTRDPSPFTFTAETGGDAWSDTNNYSGAVSRIWRESASYYLIGYTPPIADERVHKIEVKVTKPGVTVRARKARG